jgi:hypothetical protein
MVDLANDFLNCCLCLEMAIDAVECLKCHTIMCEPCTKTLKKQECPHCREDLQLAPNQLARRMIGTLPVECADCGYKTSRGELNSHLKNCPKRQYECELCVPFSGYKADFIKHVLENHKKELIKDALNPKKPEEDEEAKMDVDEPLQNTWYLPHGAISIDSASFKTDSNRDAKLGATGKFYCGGQLTYPCMCCDVACGMDNGCNCVYCMKLDLMSRRLPFEYLVNREGYASRKGKNGNYYCGRKCIIGQAFTDGHCGPTNGP